ncbi:MarR family winged helix-turn-helix transcriptional regulator [Ancylobacter sp. Lp-2]|uniref:MarR family winged helix-turn-helix transcriptional regulator n=1 Tax=Ancylobacter sp. Lp-2 TaxID=2881339 RepID=UPI001E644EF0|nr:MarR family winged helix-turn-helix transcriptional regulator [Ancylobacter sp. Lp-2]MCB4767861.1 MarR family winged helix-turn-helix transcriptional regulator [Ancylobacter sp. Lp-2]
MNFSDTISPALIQEVGQACLCRRVQRASRSVGKRFDDAFRAVGINNWQFTMLMSLVSPEPRTVNQIAAELGMDRTTTTKNLRPLERRGLIEIRPDAKDGRVRRVLLTEAGDRLLAEALVQWRGVHERLAASLTGDQLQALRRALEIISID